MEKNIEVVKNIYALLSELSEHCGVPFEDIINYGISNGDIKPKAPSDEYLETDEKIHIKPNKNGDTRVAKKLPTFNEFETANHSHIDDVKHTMTYLASKLCEAGLKHDHTKIEMNSKFFSDFIDVLKDKNKSFTQMEWYKSHVNIERHHLNDKCPSDVNLIDVIEMICDCVTAGLARSGSVYKILIPDDILARAVYNTQKMIEGVCVIDNTDPDKE